MNIGKTPDYQKNHDILNARLDDIEKKAREKTSLENSGSHR